MKVTSITRQQKNKSRYNIFLDECYAFSVDEEILVRFQLAKGKEITSAQIETIQITDKKREAFNKAIGYLTTRIRSEKEIQDHLSQYDYDQMTIKETICQLIKMNYVNDQDFAIRYVNTQIKTTLKGPETIKRELVSKGIKEELITDALTGFTYSQQIENAKRQAEKIVKRSQNAGRSHILTKVVTSLLQKGYPSKVATEAAREVCGRITEEMEDGTLAIQIEKLARKNSHLEPSKAKQKIIQSLLRKGFHYDKIQTFFNQHDIRFEK